MATLVLFTAGILLGEMHDPCVEGFMARADKIFEAVAKDEGYIAHDAFIGLDFEGPKPFGPYATPFKDEELRNRMAQTLSIWKDIESAIAFTYRGFHQDAFDKGREWFVKSEGPGYTTYWIGEGQNPTWEQGCARFDRFKREGPSPEAFTFKQPFGPDGQAYEINQELVKRKGAQNAARFAVGSGI